jgi:hypothetical protein
MDLTGLPESAIHRVRVLLQMLAIVFQSSTSKSLSLPHCASFLQTLLKGCLDLAHAWPAWEAIAGSLLTTLACLELSKDRFALIQKTWLDEGIWKSMRSPMLLVSAGERPPLSSCARRVHCAYVAAAYASHVFATARGNTVRDTDAYVRAWDMLGRQLLRVLSGEIAPDEQAIGVVCAPLLCAALCALAAPLDAMGFAGACTRFAPVHRSDRFWQPATCSEATTAATADCRASRYVSGMRSMHVCKTTARSSLRAHCADACECREPRCWPGYASSSRTESHLTNF